MLSRIKSQKQLFKNVFVLACLNIIAVVFTIEARTVNVMAPLHVQVYNNASLEEEQDWADFESYLAYASSVGVNAVSVDVWWGLVQEKGANSFDWSYYKKLFALIKKHNLQIVPIMSFHKCGGNVGDNFTKPIPEWVWDDIVNKNNEISNVEELKYISDLGNVCSEYISLWADLYAFPYYENFISDFLETFSSYAADIPELNISCGPAGELRYPSYNSHDHWNYPGFGHLQCYSTLAKQSFTKYIQVNFGDIANINRRWGSSMTDYSEISPPTNHDYFFSSGDYKNIQYGKDFTTWYNNCLIMHGQSMLDMTYKLIDTAVYSSTKIGFKIPGVHWQIVNPEAPRVAEVTAGLINSKSIRCDKNTSDTAGYGAMLANVISKELKKNQKVTLHFTCLEMTNSYDCEIPNPDFGSKDYSMAKALVFWVSDVAKYYGIELKGENALAVSPCETEKWESISDAMANDRYTGITILRIHNVCDPNTNCSPNKFLELLAQ